MKNLYKIGNVKNSHGLKGQLELKLTSNINLEEFINKNLFILINGIYKPFVIKSFFFKKNNYVISLEDLNDINKVKKIMNSSIYLSNEDIMNSSFKKEEFLIGYDVIDYNTKKIIGRIIDIDNKKINKLITFYDFNKERDILVPFVSNFVKNINYNSKKIVLNIIDGM